MSVIRAFCPRCRKIVKTSHRKRYKYVFNRYYCLHCGKMIEVK